MKLIQRVILGIYLSVSVWPVLANDNLSYVTPVSVEQLVAEGFNGVILDVRTVEEFSESHVPDAVNVPHELLSSHLATLGRTDTPLLVYCRSGRRAQIAMEQLHALGYTRLYHLSGDMQAWQTHQQQ